MEHIKLGDLVSTPLILETCRHEAGHFIANKELGFNAKSLWYHSIDKHGKYEAHAEVEYICPPLSEKQALSDFLCNRIVCLYSGSIAGTLFKNKINVPLALDELINRTGKSDLAKSLEALLYFRQNRLEDTQGVLVSHPQSEEVCNGLWDRAIALVKLNASAIHQVAELLASKIIYVGDSCELTVDVITNAMAVESSNSLED